MEKLEELRRYLIYILKNSDVFYITKDKVEREIYKLDQINDEIEEDNKIINNLYGIRSNQIVLDGKASENIEALLLTYLNNMSYLNFKKQKWHCLDIHDDDTLDVIAAKIREICVDGVVDNKIHLLTDEEEKLLEEASVKTLKRAREKGIEEERKYLQEMRRENLEKRKQEEQEDMDLIYVDEELFKDAKVYKLIQAREKGIKEEQEFLMK